MSDITQFQRLGRCLAGAFQNRQQALAEPSWYVHLKLWIHPTALFAEDSLTFFMEQASAAYKQPPYRQRLLRLRLQATTLTAEYYALKQPEAFCGAAQSPARLAQLTTDDLQMLEGSTLLINSHSNDAETRFEARQYPGERCQFLVNGETKYVELAFDAIAPHSADRQQGSFLMYDKGIDPDTGKATWGALRGPFRLLKVEDLGDALNFEMLRLKS